MTAIDAKKATPVMRQFWAVKEKNKDAIILFRMGDFYETFEKDAEIASSILGIALTKRSNGAASSVPLAGFPYHSLEQYLYKLLKAGHKVAICEQVEDASDAKGIVRREVVEVVSPGTTISEKFLDNKVNNYLCSIYYSGLGIDLSILDHSTGEFYVNNIASDNFDNFISKYNISEFLVFESQKEIFSKFRSTKNMLINYIPEWVNDFSYANEILCNHFSVKSMKGFGLNNKKSSIISSGVIIHYLNQNFNKNLSHINNLKFLSDDSAMQLDYYTVRNLELFESLLGNEKKKGTLLSAIDKTVTASGSRLLRNWIYRPLINKDSINARLDIIQDFVDDYDFMCASREELKTTYDIKRIISKISCKKANPLDIINLSDSLNFLNDFKKSIPSNRIKVKHLVSNMHNTKKIIKIVQETLKKQPSININKGNFIKDGFSIQLDELRVISNDANKWMLNYQEKLKNETKISSLKIGFNKVFGYYIDVTKTHLDKVPDYFIKKQTLVNNERYFTDKLKEFEDKILNADHQIIDLENKIFQNLCNQIIKEINPIQFNADIISKLDIFCSLAYLSIKNKYTRPIINNGFILDIKGGRHPVVEQLILNNNQFISNDALLNQKEFLSIITGPNMAGKSTYLRQVGLIIIMAQIGSFVPADSAKIGIIDKLFTRVGASDNLAEGESTFLVEMQEAANIINNASSRSLILLDEIGRGTSTYDGLSIAWAITEYIHNHIKSKTFFATHYHELVELADNLKNGNNLNVLVEESSGKSDIVFLRKIVKGGTDKSYGIYVAKMAGLPTEIIKKSQIYLEFLTKEQKKTSLVNNKEIQSIIRNLEKNKNNFTEDFINELKKINIDEISPLEGLNILNEMIKKYVK